MTEILRLHGGRMLAAARKILANEDEARDAFQDGMLAAWKSLPTFEGRSELSTWVHRIVVNHALERLRKRQRQKEQSLESLLPTYTDYGHHLESPKRWAEEPAEILQRSELCYLVNEKIARLPESYRLPLILFEIENREISEIAALLCTSNNAVRIRVHRARQALKTLLEPHVVETEAS